MAVFVIDAVRGPHFAHVLALHAVELDGPRPARLQAHELAKVPRGTLAHAIGEERYTLGDRGGHVLHLDVAGLAARRLEHEIDAARFLAVGHLAARARIAAELADRPVPDRLGHERVGQPRVDPDHHPPDLDDLPGVAILARGPIALGQPHAVAGIAATHHGTGVGARRGDDALVAELHVGEEALVAADQPPLDESRAELHPELAMSEALPPAAVVFTVNVRSVAKRKR